MRFIYIDSPEMVKCSICGKEIYDEVYLKPIYADDDLHLPRCKQCAEAEELEDEA